MTRNVGDVLNVPGSERAVEIAPRSATWRAAPVCDEAIGRAIRTLHDHDLENVERQFRRAVAQSPCDPHGMGEFCLAILLAIHVETARRSELISRALEALRPPPDPE